jgi:hypothetical protein
MDRTLGIEPGETSAKYSAEHVGYVRFAPALERDAACARLCEEGWLVAVVEIESRVRGRLYEAIDAAVEIELAEWDASGAAPGGSRGVAAALLDQLQRARRAGARGIAILVDPLRAAAGAMGALEPRDSAVLRFLAEAAQSYSVALWLDERDATTGGYADPVELAELLGRAIPATESTTDGPPERVADRETGADESASDGPASDDDAEPPAPPPPPPATSVGSGSGVSAIVAERDETWRAWTLQLAAARGPQPLSALEKLFTESYVPLSNALAAGLDDPRAKNAHDEFRQTFARGYAEAFSTFAVTTKRPRMVLDVHDIAARIARLHGARSTRLLLVDGMRWDVSRMVEQHLGAKLGSRAAVTDEILLWSALPTTTMRQLETIARGVDALRAPAELDADGDLPRGRTAEYIRRLRVGPRELHKLDVVEARLSSSRGSVLRSLPGIAEATADVIARHAETLAPHTLLFVFGDHGFTIDRSGSAQQGGASPEEVLVGGFSLLVGDVH